MTSHQVFAFLLVYLVASGGVYASIAFRFKSSRWSVVAALVPLLYYRPPFGLTDDGTM
jgi:hypothetical protein